MLKKLGFQTKDQDPSEIEKTKSRHNKKVLQKTTSYDSLESESFAPQPHKPSTIYSPNPFPLDPSQPDGVNRNNLFHTHHHHRQTRELETVDIEIEETKGFVSGKSRKSIDRDDIGDEIEASKMNNPIHKLGAGLKGALAKSGLGKSKDKEKENDVEVDAVLQHNLQQQKRQQRQQQQEAPVRGREREKERTQSGHLYLERMGRNDAISPDRNRERREARKTRIQSLSPPPALGRDRRDSTSYWPEDHRNGIYSEQITPFIGYQPPPVSPSRRQHQQYRQQRPQPRPLSTSALEYVDQSRPSRDGRYRSRERRESDRTRHEVLGGGVRHQSGLNKVTGADSVAGSSEFGDDEGTSIDRQQKTPDRLSRAKEWVANHSKNNSISTPAPVADREALQLASLPGALPSKPNRRYSMDPEEYGLISPPRGSYQINGGGGYDSRERIAMSQMQSYEERDYRESMDDGRYWSRQLEGYEQDRYRESRVDYGYGQHDGYHGYAAGGADDYDDDEVESTLAPGSAVGVGPTKKGLEDSKGALNTPVTNTEVDIEEDPLASPKAPNRKRLILRLVSLISSIFVLLFLIAAAPISKSTSPFSSQAGLAFHYIVAILSILVSLAFVFNYLSRRLRRREKMKRYILFALDIVMALAWLIDIFVCITKFPCAVGGQHGWCDMYNTSIFLGMIGCVSYLVAFAWDIWGSFDHSKLYSGGPLIKPPPPGFEKSSRKKLASGGMGRGGMQGVGSAPGAWPGQMPGQIPGQIPGQGMGKKGKNSKALW